MPIFYVDGRFLPAEEAVIPVDDLAVLRGIGVFDLLRTYAGQPLFLKEHVQRLIQSARQIDLALPWPHAEICRLALETLSRNDFEEANIRIVVTGGSSTDFMTPQGKPRLLILVTPLPKIPAQWYDDGVNVVTVHAERRIPGAKSLDYLTATLALRQGRDQGAVEAIYIDRNDLALEGTTSNLFAVIDGRLVTPGSGILSGITRQVVLEVAKEILPVDIRDLPCIELLNAREVFITGTNKGLVPVVQIDDTPIGDRRPGPFTRRITSALKAHFSQVGVSAEAQTKED